MSELRTHKFVAALPPVLEADAIYFVRTGAGYDQYVTNHSGTIVAYSSNSAPKDSPVLTGAPLTTIVSYGAGVDAQIASQKYTRDAAQSIADSSFDSKIVATRPKGLSTFCSGKPSANEVIGGGISPYAMTANVTKSAASALVAATASTTFLIKKGSTQIGTVVFSPAGTVGALSFSITAIALGDTVTVHAPNTPDATLADITILVREF